MLHTICFLGPFCFTGTHTEETEDMPFPAGAAHNSPVEDLACGAFTLTRPPTPPLTLTFTTRAHRHAEYTHTEAMSGTDYRRDTQSGIYTKPHAHTPGLTETHNQHRGGSPEGEKGNHINCHLHEFTGTGRTEHGEIVDTHTHSHQSTDK